MINRKSHIDKNFIAVLFFIIFITLSIVGIAKLESKKEYEDTSFNPAKISTSNVPSIKESESVVIVTSNNNQNNSSKGSSGSKKGSSKGSGKGGSTGSSNIPVDYFITELSSNKIYVGGTSKVSVDIYPENATVKKVSYSSTNNNVAKVDKNGYILGISPGVCYIELEVEGAGSSRVQVQVYASEANNVTPVSNKVSNTKSNVVSNKVSNRVSSTTSNKTSNRVSNRTSNSTSNRTSNSTSNSNTKQDVAVSAVGLNFSQVTFKPGESFQLKATVYPSDATNKNITWTSSSPSVVTVSNGKITGVKEGTSIITAKSNNGKYATCKVEVYKPAAKKNGWYTENGKKYYYSNNTKLKNQFVDYIYLDGNGVAQSKIGSFDITLYGTIAWVARYSSSEPYLYLKSSASSSSSTIKTLQPGTKVTIIGNESNGYLKVKTSDNKTGWIWANSTFVNLPDLMPSIKYNITNAKSSIFQVSDGKALGSEKRYNITGVTGKNLYASATGTNYGFGTYYNSKIRRNEYYVPLLYPTAKKLQNALKSAKAKGYNFMIYDTYRPTGVEDYVKSKYMAQYQNYSSVQRDRNGNYWGWTWFMTAQGKGSRHSQGIAIDLALTNSSGTELKAQSKIHTLDTSSLRKYNNVNAVKLSDFMTGAGFKTLESEWWHYQDDTFSSRLYENFKLN